MLFFELGAKQTANEFEFLRGNVSQTTNHPMKILLD